MYAVRACVPALMRRAGARARRLLDCPRDHDLPTEAYIASYVCFFYLIDHKLFVPADAALVVVLSDADSVDELFFGAQGIVKGMHVLPALLCCQPACQPYMHLFLDKLYVAYI
jgi:hypothetical protein